jgi:hypothetical protein
MCWVADRMRLQRWLAAVGGPGHVAEEGEDAADTGSGKRYCAADQLELRPQEQVAG